MRPLFPPDDPSSRPLKPRSVTAFRVSSTSAAPKAPITSIESSASCSGNTWAWLATRTVWRRRSARFGPCARSSTKTSGAGHRGHPEPESWKRPAGWLTSSNWANSWPETHWIVKSPAAATSERNTSWMTARPKRNDDSFQHVSAWEWHDADTPQTKHAEQLEFEYVKPSTRSYK